MKYHYTQKSFNAKLGPIPATMTSQDSCPASCPLRAGGGCYAETGPLSWIWRKLPSLALSDLYAHIRTLPAGQPWRHNQAGDLPGDTVTLDREACTGLRDSASHTRGWTYTHYAPAGKNRVTIRQMNAKPGLTVNLSADDMGEADEFAALGIAPVVVTVSRDHPARSTTPAGHTVVVCPAQKSAGTTCAKCLLCARRDRKVIIAFRAHGVGAKRLEARLAS
jgi:hypothetical protein